MDARITKSRLANLLSYDWLKIVAAILAAVLVICVFFTTVKTRPGKYHTFTVYGYRELVEGGDANGFLERLQASRRRAVRGSTQTPRSRRAAPRRTAP